MKKLSTIGVVYLLTALTLPIFSFGTSINYSTDSYESIIQKSKTQNKYFFVRFTANWCTTCKVMEENSNNNSTLVNFINKNFLAVKADMDTPSGQQWKDQLNVCCLPTLIAFSPDGQELGRKEGGIPSSEFLSFLENISEKKSTLPIATTFSPPKPQLVSLTSKGKTINNNSIWTITSQYTQLKNANTEIKNLKQKLNHDIFMNAKREKNKMVYQISIRNISDQKEAVRIMNELQSENIQYFLKKTNR